MQLPLNSHLAFAPANTNVDVEMTIPQMCHIADEADCKRLEALVDEAYEKTATWSESLSYISERVQTPQELVFASFCMLLIIHTSKQRRQEKVEKAIRSALGLSDKTGVTIIEL